LAVKGSTTGATVPDERVAMGLWFYPRGGSAQVVRYLAYALPGAGWDPSIYCGTIGSPGDESNAATFFAGLDVHAADYGPALAAAERGDDPLAAPMPLHASYEDRPGAPDRVLASVDPALLDHHADAWARVFADGDAGTAACFHLHHLTPQHEAVARRFPAVPVLGQFHGTDMKMLDALDHGAPWAHGEFWRAAMRRWAQSCDGVAVISPHDRDEASRLLGVESERVTWIPNGIDIDRFHARALSLDERLAALRHWLVDDPRGWREGAEPGSIAYAPDVLDRFVDPGTGEARPVLLFIGRFISFKRVPLLIRAYARARARFPVPAPLVVWGGHPGEWEGEHPHTVAVDAGVDDDVLFVGWRGHDDLPLGLACADVMVGPSVNESFGQVFLEAMGCRVPVITTATGGPLSFVNTVAGKPNGWLVPPDDEEALADALVEAVTNADERRVRGANAYAQARADYSWRHLADRYAESYEAAIARRAATGPTGGAASTGAP